MTIDEINIPQATSSEFQLVCKRTGETFALADEMLIGQAEDCTIAISALKIRRYHAKLSKTDDGLFLEDLNSQNNTYLNGCRIGTGAWVTLGDEINFDGVKFLIESQDKNPKNSDSDDILNIKLHDKPLASTQSSIRPHPLPSVPFSNQDVLEVTRALEARAKERLQLYKEQEAKLNPDWESFIAKRQPSSLPKTPTEATRATALSEKKLSSKEVGEQKERAESAISSTETTEFTKTTELTKTAPPAKAPNLGVVKNNNATSQAKKNVAVSQITLPSLDAANDIFIAPDSTKTEHGSPNKTSSEQANAKQSSLAIASTNHVSADIESDNARLIVQTAPTRGKYYVLAATDAKKMWTIGRAKKADIQLREGSIDLIHAHIELSGEGYKIRTTRTTNGMLVNGKLKNETILKQGDNIQFGRVSFKFQTQTQSPKSTTEEASGTKINYGILVGSLIVLGALLVALTQQPF